MELNDRKLKILQAIILNYLETAEPVGSRTISKKYDLGISSATIRNEMSDLEEMGFIVQPHTSAGRIPSEQGYRLYVDHLMNSNYTESQKALLVQKILLDKMSKLDNILKDIGDLLALATNYTTIVTTPQLKKTRLKHLQLIPLDDQSIILLIVTDGNVVKNNVIAIEHALTNQEMSQISDMLNDYLNGLTLEEINLPLIQRIKDEMKEQTALLDCILDAISKTIEEADSVDVYTSGTTNILNFPEFNDVLKIKQLIGVLEKKDQVLSLMSSKNEETLKTDKMSEINISIGSENEMEAIKDCSIITTTYKVGGEVVGTIGIIGPVRMDYEKVVSTLEYLTEYIEPIFNHKQSQKRIQKKE